MERTEIRKKLKYIDNLINDLSCDEKYIIPIFLLKAQYIEYGLKYLLEWYPYKNKINYPLDFIEKATMGQIMGKLKEINDDHLEDIIEDANEFVKTRNLVTHHIIISDKDICDIEKECAQKIITANSIEEKIDYLIEYAEGVFYGERFNYPFY